MPYYPTNSHRGTRPTVAAKLELASSDFFTDLGRDLFPEYTGTGPRGLKNLPLVLNKALIPVAPAKDE